MPSIARIALENLDHSPWDSLVARSLHWLDTQSCLPRLRDVVVLLPFAQLLPPARQAWARAGGWQPRIESTQTLARSLGPPSRPQEGQLSFDVATDRLTGARLLRQPRAQALLGHWLRREPSAQAHLVASLVDTAHGLARAAANRAPAAREAWWAEARLLLSGQDGPGGLERALASLALDWAARGPAPDSDRLFGLEAAAWIGVLAGGEQPLLQALLAHHAEHSPCLLLDSNPPHNTPLLPSALAADLPPLQLQVCADLEDEAQCTAAQVLVCLAGAGPGDGGQAMPPLPVALVAQDRLLVRRVRALLQRQGVALQDETGWKLSTTRAAAPVVAMLRATEALADMDSWLDWLKGGAAMLAAAASREMAASRDTAASADTAAVPEPADAAPRPGRGGAAAVEAIEALARRHGWRQPQQVDEDKLTLPSAAKLWRGAQAAVVSLQQPPKRSLWQWQQALLQALDGLGQLGALQADDAGRQVLQLLTPAEAAEEGAGGPELLDLPAFLRWVDDSFEQALFVPPTPPRVDVVVTPLQRTLLRPFAAVVMPGVDERHLGAAASPHPLLAEAELVALGLPSAALRQQADLLAFAHVLRVPRLVLLHRRDNGGEPLAESPWLERLRAEPGARQVLAAADHRRWLAPAAEPVPLPQAVAARMLPQRLSASACEALRACPYRFFALQMLRLKPSEELDEGVEKRDYGTWLHAVLHAFHQQRPEPAPLAQDTEALQRLARETLDSQRLDEAAFLPYMASFERLLPRYLAWLHQRDAEGAQWLDGEAEFSHPPPAWAGVVMQGRIDRIDRVQQRGEAVSQLIDYKTGSAQALRQRLKNPLEDTQLAFYAALVAGQSSAAGGIEAAYLPLEDNKPLQTLLHPDVESSAELLVQGLGEELAAIRGGAVLRALGEGDACNHCDARGLCRRDHWPAAEPVQEALP